MKNLILFLCLTLLLACSKSNPSLRTITYYNKLFSIEQTDSIIKAEEAFYLDSIPIITQDSAFYEYYYINDSLILRFIEKKDSVQVTKRINKIQ